MYKHTVYAYIYIYTHTYMHCIHICIHVLNPEELVSLSARPGVLASSAPCRPGTVRLQIWRVLEDLVALKGFRV